MSRLELFVSHVHVIIDCPLESAAVVLTAVWSGARTPYVPSRRSVSVRVESDSLGWTVLCDERPVYRGMPPEDVPPAIERELYRALLDPSSVYTVFHAACLARDRTAVLLVGESGSGKSSLAACALRAGFEYFGDEHTVTDGERLWGVPRAVQFELVNAGAVLPRWIQAADVISYPVRDRNGTHKVLPFFSVSERVAPRALPAERAWIFFPRHRSRTLLRSRSPLEALHGLHEATLGSPRVPLGKLVGPARAFDLEWSDPDAAVEKLWAAVSDGISLGD